MAQQPEELPATVGEYKNPAVTIFLN